MEFNWVLWSRERGARQGDPFSHISLYFFIQICEDKTIKGFRFKTVEVKLTAYADDTTETNVKNNEEFEKFFSLREIVEKCEVCWIGKAKKFNT